MKGCWTQCKKRYVQEPFQFELVKWIQRTQFSNESRLKNASFAYLTNIASCYFAETPIEFKSNNSLPYLHYTFQYISIKNILNEDVLTILRNIQFLILVKVSIFEGRSVRTNIFEDKPRVLLAICIIKIIPLISEISKVFKFKNERQTTYTK